MSKSWAPALAAFALVALVAAGALIASHPTVHSTSTDEDFPCLASWDVVLNGASNDPDGFPPVAGEHIGDRCVSAAHRRFWWGAAWTALGATSLLGAGVLEVRSRRRG